MGDYDEPLGHLKKALQLHRSANNYYGITETTANIALIYERRGDYAKALQYYDTCLLLTRKHNLPDLKLHVYHNIYKTYELAGIYQKAFEFQSNYLALKDSLMDAQRAIAVEDMERRYQAEKKESQLLQTRNKVLETQLLVKKRTSERNLISIIGLAVLIILGLILIIHFLRSRKNRIIREKEIARLDRKSVV